MKITIAALATVLVGGLIGCWNDERRDRDHERGMYGDDSVPQTRGGPHDDATRLQADPVCGLTVSPWESVSEVYDGQTYYFHDRDCAQKFRDNPTAFLPGHDVRDNREVRADGTVKDPVCGHDVNVRDAKYCEEYDHKKYYFDSKECARKFKDNPHAYLPGGDDRPGVRDVR
jgi:P-type Cu+ transporter